MLQWLILFIYSFINVLCAFSVSIQGSIYPMIAELKEATPSEYGMVFGVFSLVLFLTSPLSGMMINKLGGTRVSLIGLLTIGITTIMFGFVDRINGSSLFIQISIVIRIFEGIGYSMVRNAVVAVMSFEFSEHAEMAFAFVQTFFSTGLLIGPVAGGALFELGGFFLPFVFTGALLFLSAFALLFLPKNYPEQEQKSYKQILKVLTLRPVIVGVLSVWGAYFNTGFLFTALEPHLQKLHLSPVQVGLMFLCNGLACCVSSFIWSKLCEKNIHPEFLCTFSAFIIICGLIILGPAPYFPTDISVSTCALGLLIHGIGIGGDQIAGFSCLNKGAKEAGFPKSIQTYGLVSTIYTASFSLGCFIGPLVGGYAYEILDFSLGSHIFVIYHLLLATGTIISLQFPKRESETCLSPHDQTTVKYQSIEDN